MKDELMWLVHNCIAHPIAGVLWLCRCTRLADWMHDVTMPKQEETNNDHN